MPAPRKRDDREPSNEIAGTPATVPTATGEIPNSVQLARARTHDAIACRAYQLFEERGSEPGREWEDWFRAEREL